MARLPKPKPTAPVYPGEAEVGELIGQGHGSLSGWATQPERVEDIPDYDKLTRVERWMMDKLPGFAESGVGQALQKFAEGPIGKALMVLDIGAEAVERLYGLAWQYDQAKDDPVAMRELRTNLGAAWQAGSLASDFTNAPLYRDGKWVTTTDMPGHGGLVEARQRIIAGEDLETVRNSMMDNLGVLALRAQKQDAIQHIIADPLWIIGKWVKPLEFIKTRAIRKLTSAALPEEVFKLTTRMDDALKIIDDVDNFAHAEKLLKAAEHGTEEAAILAVLRTTWDDIGKTSKKADVISALKKSIEHQLSLAELTPAQQRLSQFAGGIMGFDKPYDELTKFNKLVRKYSPFALTPAARASELWANMYNWLGAYVFGKTDDVGEMVRIIERAVDGAVGPELGHMIVTMEGRQFTGMLKMAASEIGDLKKAWDAAGSFERPLLEMFERVLGETSGAIFSQLKKGETAQIFERFMRNVGDFPEIEQRLAGLLASQGYPQLTSEVLGRIPSMISEELATSTHFGAKLADIMGDVGLQHSIIHFGVGQEGVLTKLSDTMRAVESLAYLGLNPAYPIRNAINNVATAIARGHFGIVTLKEVERSFKELLGFFPARAGEAYTPAILAQKTSEAVEGVLNLGRSTHKVSKGLRDVLVGKKGWLDNVNNMVRNFSSNRMPLLKWARNIEQGASQRALYLGMTDFFKMQCVPGKGFSKLGKFDAALAQELGDDVVRQLENAAYGAYSEKILNGRFYDTDNIRMSIGNVMRDAEERFGGEFSGIFRGDVIDQIEQIILPAAKKGRGALDDAIGEMKNVMRRHVEDTVDNFMEVRIQEALARLETEGPSAIQGLWGELANDVYSTEIRHAIMTEQMASDIRKGTDPAISGARWNQLFEESDHYWSRSWARQEKLYKAISKASPIEEGVQIYPKFKELRTTWKGFYKKRKSLWDTLSEQRTTGAKVTKTPQMIKDELNAMYETAIAIEDRVFREVDELIIRMHPDEEIQGLMRIQRTKIADMRVADREFTKTFRQQIDGLPDNEIEAMYQGYWKERQMRSSAIHQESLAMKAAQEGNQDAVSYINRSGDIRTRLDELEFGALPEDRVTSSLYSHSSKHLDPNGRIDDYITRYTEAKDPQILKEFIQDEPMAGLMTDWVINSNPEAKLALIDYIKANPLEAKEIQRYTNYVLLGKYGDDMTVRSGKVTMYRTLGGDADMVRPWDSMTQNPGFARAWQQSEGRGAILEYEVPTRNVFASHETYPGARASIGEEEVFLNQYGIQGGGLISVDGKPPTPEDFAKYSGVPSVIEDRVFLQDFHEIVPREMPYGVGMEEFIFNRASPALDAIGDSAHKIAQEPPLKFANIPTHLQSKVRQYGEHLGGQMADIRFGGLKFGEWTRDSALLNYNRRVNLDTWLQWAVPYEFWMTHTAWNWALHTLNRPHITANILRTKKMLDTGFRPETGFPQRLKGHIRIKVPFLPKLFGDWMGDTIFINPLSAAIPIDNFARPFEEMAGQERRDQGMAERILEELLNDNEITHEQYIEAMQTHGGSVWDRAVALGQQDDTEQRSNAFDLAAMVLNPHAPIMWAYNASKGEEFQKGPFIPLSRSIQAVAGLFGTDINDMPILGIGGKIREAMGLHPYDEWQDYRTNRMMVNMLSLEEEIDGVPITVEDVKRAMIEQEGPVWEEGKKRAQQQYGIDAMGSITGLPMKAYPAGEEKVREKRDDYERMWEAYEAGDTDAYGRFLEANPDYEARLALFKEPEEQLRAFLIDQLWDTYNDMPSLHKREINEQIGGDFERGFLNKETRSTDSIPVEQLAVWLKLMGGDPPGTLGKGTIPLEKAPPEIAQAAQFFYNHRRQNYPNYYELQNVYFRLEEGAPRRRYLMENPELEQYWTWRRDFLYRNPTTAPYLTENPPKYESEELLRVMEAREPQMTPQEIQASVGPIVYGYIYQLVMANEPIPQVAMDTITIQAANMGMSVEELMQMVAKTILP